MRIICGGLPRASPQFFFFYRVNPPHPSGELEFILSREALAHRNSHPQQQDHNGVIPRNFANLGVRAYKKS